MSSQTPALPTSTTSRRARVRTLRPARRLLAVGAATVLVSGGGLAAAAGLEPDPTPEAYAGAYAVYLDGRFVGQAHAFSGCETEVRETATVTYTPCNLDVGLAMAPDFRAFVASAAANTDQTKDIVIARAPDGTRTARGEVAFRGRVVALTLPALRAAKGVVSPAWMRVQLRAEAGTLKRDPLSARKVPLTTDAPIEASALSTVIDHVDATGVRAVDPLRMTRKATEAYEPGRLITHYSPMGAEGAIRALDGSTSIASLSAWFDERLAGAKAARGVKVVYQDATGANRLTVSTPMVPVAYDPFARTDGQRIVRLLQDTNGVPSVTW